MLFNLIHNVQQMAAKPWAVLAVIGCVFCSRSFSSVPSCGVIHTRSVVALRSRSCNILADCKVYNRITLLALLHTAVLAYITTYLLLRTQERLDSPGFLSHTSKCSIVSIILEATMHSACCLFVQDFYGFKKIQICVRFFCKDPHR